MSSFVYYDLENKLTGEVFTLKYQIDNNTLASKWFSFLSKSIEEQHIPFEGGCFYGAEVQDLNKIKKDLKYCVDTFNNYCVEKNYEEHINFDYKSELTRELLNYLHDQFEFFVHDERFSVIENIEVQNALSELNRSIHKGESFLPSNIDNGCFIEVIISKSSDAISVGYVDLDKEDYNHFTTELGFAELFVTYGMTGQPTMNAYWGKSIPRPQNCFTCGAMLSFFHNSTLGSEERLKAKKWLWENHQIDIDDPTSAVGYLKVGKLVTTYKSRGQLLKKIKDFKHVKSVRCEGISTIDSQDLIFTNPAESERVRKSWDKEKFTEEVNSPVSEDCEIEATWPYDREIFAHLAYKPYIDLKYSFNTKDILEEANKALDYFVTHRGYDQESLTGSGEWKSLSLQSVEGDYKKTSYHTEYGYELNSKNIYRQTPFAQLCPETMKFIKKLTDISQCERIRFMLLEPGAKIAVHRDMKDGAVGLAINISLNMPKGCVFQAGLNSDGTSNKYTTQLPFSNDGSVMIFNNGEYHSVTNESDTPRIHIIFHGPTKFSDEYILNCAREQNSLTTKQEIIEHLAKKRNDLNLPAYEFAGPAEEITYNSVKGTSETSIVEPSTLSTAYSIAVMHSEHLDEETKIKVTDKITYASLFPLEYDRINALDCDQYLEGCIDKNIEFAVLINQGTYVISFSDFVRAVEVNIERMRNENAVMCGHIMDFQRDSLLPYMHEQFLIVDVKKWQNIGKTKIGNFFNEYEIDFPPYLKSKESVHDDYTPLWIKPGDNETSRKGKPFWGTEAIISAIKNGYSVINLENTLREQKQYCYPLDGLDQRYTTMRESINSWLQNLNQQTFFFNNEPLDIWRIKELRPKHFISVSSGFKPAKLFDIYINNSENYKVDFIDVSEMAFKYMKSLIKCESLEDSAKLIDNLSKINMGEKYTYEQALEKLQDVIIPDFGNEGTFISSLRKLREANFNKVNLLEEAKKVVDLINPEQTSLIWTSNAFYSNPTYFQYSEDEANSKLLNMVQQIADKYAGDLYKHKRSPSFYVGKGTEVMCLITDGCVYGEGTSTNDWERV